MRNFFKALLLLVATTVAVSCSKDKPSGSLKFDVPAVYMRAGSQVTVHYIPSSNISASACYVSGKPEGWDDPKVDAASRTITITAPSDFDGADVAKSGTISFSGAPKGGSISTATLFVGVVDDVAFSGAANAYIASKPAAHYTFDGLHKGDGISPLATTSVELLWQTKSNLLQYVTFADGRVSFYVGSDSDGELQEGNALLGAYDAEGGLIWSWHVWVVDYDPESAEGQVELNGFTMMDRNLGALRSANSDTSEILDSYGLYYQWGRKDPFIGPSTYNAGSGISAAMYDAAGKRTYHQFEESSAETGTALYVERHPMTFLLAGEKADWLWQGQTAVRWSDTKSVSDPCPYGWRTAPAAAFDGLSIVEDIAAEGASDRYAEAYGWTLTDGGQQSFFLGAGYRTYLDGKINNIYDNIPVRSGAVDMQPWIGCYWTTSAVGNQAGAFYFWFNKSDVVSSGVGNGEAMGRANGMQVRCVKAR